MTQDERAADMKLALGHIEGELNEMKKNMDQEMTREAFVALIDNHSARLKAMAMCLDYQCKRYLEINNFPGGKK